MDSDDMGCLGIVIVILGVLALVFNLGHYYGCKSEREVVYKEAVTAGAGEWVLVVEKDGSQRTEFRWKGNVVK
jgi:microcompartment protein CcmK/EutM